MKLFPSYKPSDGKLDKRKGRNCETRNWRMMNSKRRNNKDCMKINIYKSSKIHCTSLVRWSTIVSDF